jgi:uncharacterized surface protein with fasciclin (FAS1) repeats
MKNLFKNYNLLTLLFLGLMTISCSDDDDTTASNPEAGTIVEIALDTPDLSSLVAALGAADGDLVSVLSSGDFTVLAPTNAAFESFLSQNGFASLEDVPTDLLANILLNHVISESVSSTDLVTLDAGYSTTNATNADGDNLSIYFNTSDGVVFNGISSVTVADVNASNGIVHVVDAVIGLPSIVTFATADPTFETLVAALTVEGLQQDFVSILSSSDEPAPLTVFAPTNAAFGDLLSDLGYSTLAEIDLGLLENVLGMHVVPEANVRSDDLTEGMEVVTASDQAITISLITAPNITDPNELVSNIIAVDVQAMNGVVHAIDKVISPLLD